jgi:hydroxypyruvate isomerase
MKLCANLSLMYAGMPLDQAMANAAAHGFDTVEILFPYQQPAAWLNQQLLAHGLTLALVNTPLGPNGQKGLACVPGCSAQFRNAMTQALEVCEATGCKTVHVMAGCPGNNAAAAAKDTLIQNLQWACAQAQETGVTLTLEGLNRQDVPGYFYHTPAQVLAIVHEVNAPTLKLQFDFYHTQKEGLDLVHELRRCAQTIHHVQFARPQGRHEPDLADINVQEGLKALWNMGYSGRLGCEYIPAGDVLAGLNAWRTPFHALMTATSGNGT